MPLKYFHGDLLQASVDIIAHGCNCQQIMGAGIAKYISQIYPEVRRADRHFLFPYQEGAHEIYDIPNKNPLILAADKQSFYEVPLERVVSITKVKDVLQGNDEKKYDVVIEDNNERRLFI